MLRNVLARRQHTSGISPRERRLSSCRTLTGRFSRFPAIAVNDRSLLQCRQSPASALSASYAPRPPADPLRSRHRRLKREPSAEGFAGTADQQRQRHPHNPQRASSAPRRDSITPRASIRDFSAGISRHSPRTTGSTSTMQPQGPGNPAGKSAQLIRRRNAPPAHTVLRTHCMPALISDRARHLAPCSAAGIAPAEAGAIVTHDCGQPGQPLLHQRPTQRTRRNAGFQHHHRTAGPARVDCSKRPPTSIIRPGALSSSRYAMQLHQICRSGSSHWLPCHEHYLIARLQQPALDQQGIHLTQHLVRRQGNGREHRGHPKFISSLRTVSMEPSSR